ncbi:hypothetical protein D9M70_487240 [compost metagenome]
MWGNYFRGERRRFGFVILVTVGVPVDEVAGDVLPHGPLVDRAFGVAPADLAFEVHDTHVGQRFACVMQ